MANIITEDISFGNTSDIDTSESEDEDISFTVDRLQAEQKDQSGKLCTVEVEENMPEDDEDLASVLEWDSSEDIATVIEEDCISEFTSSSSESEYLSDSSAKDLEHANNDDVDVLPPDDSVSSNVTTPADDKDYDIGQDKEWKQTEKERFSAIFDQPECVMFSFLCDEVRYRNNDRMCIVWATSVSCIQINISCIMQLIFCEKNLGL